ncbi:MAG: hypothetical protein K1X28_02530 [Parachlamydiales bacterium]|nr:hypothetical protein [Parachlamydiales bacterium]
MFKTINELIRKIVHKQTKPEDIPPIRVVEYEGNLYTLDNRRLYAFQQAGLDKIPIQKVSIDDPQIEEEFVRKFRPPSQGEQPTIILNPPGYSNTNEEIKKLKKKSLTRVDFERFPIWTWDEGKDYVQPVNELEPSVDDYYDTFIKARFKVDRHHFDGYLMCADRVFGFAIFVDSTKFMFNEQLSSYNKIQMNNFLEYLDCKLFPFFPIGYETDVKLKGFEENIGYLSYKLASMT